MGWKRYRRLDHIELFRLQQEVENSNKKPLEDYRKDNDYLNTTQHFL